jgi:hypothetical protein
MREIKAKIMVKIKEGILERSCTPRLYLNLYPCVVPLGVTG